uniref:Uncharacterized protein n=1 Tax=Oryza nivara TaxID=4536 RepID=A0A0E0J5L0_ORYNI
MQQLKLRPDIVDTIRDEVNKYHHKDFLLGEDGQRRQLLPPMPPANSSTPVPPYRPAASPCCPISPRTLRNLDYHKPQPTAAAAAPAPHPVIDAFLPESARSERGRETHVWFRREAAQAREGRRRPCPRCVAAVAEVWLMGSAGRRSDVAWVDGRCGSGGLA